MTDPHEETAISTIVTSSRYTGLVNAWIDAKFHRSTSKRTEQAYRDTMSQFLELLSLQGLDLGGDPAAVALLAQVYAGRRLPTSRHKGEVSQATYNHRLSVLSSFYRYAKKQGTLAENPIERLDRAKVDQYAGAQPLEETFIVDALSSIDQSTLSGKRDYALLSVLLQTCRRAQEVVSLTWRDVRLQKDRVTLTFAHCKGGKTMIDALPASTSAALLRWLKAFYGAKLGKLDPDTPLWVSLARDSSHGQQLGYHSLSVICKKYLGTSKVHVTRHTSAYHLEQIGAPVSDIQARLGHESLAETGTYLFKLKRAENRHGDQLAALYGIE